MDASVGERIRKLRDMAGLDGRTTDRVVGVAGCYTRLIETGKRGKQLTADVAGRYADAFGVGLDWLLTGRGKGPVAEAVRAAVARARKRAA